MRPTAEDFDDWVLRNRVGLQKSAYLILGDWHTADDVVQDALVKTYPRWGKVAERGDPLPYLRKVVVRLCIDHGRRPARRERPHGELPDRAQAVEAASADDRLLLALSTVPPKQRAVLVLRYWDDLTVQETAEATRTSVGNVKSQASRGLATLRASLGREVPSHD